MSLSRLGFARKLALRDMRDTCEVFPRMSGSRDPYGYRPGTSSSGTQVLCHFDPTGSDEVGVATTQTGIADATVYLPLTVNVRTTDRVRMTHLNGDGRVGTGDALTPPLVFQVIGMPEVQQTTIMVQLQTAVDQGG